MEPLSSSLLPAIAKAVLSQAAAKLAEPAFKGMRCLVFGDPEQRALERAIQRAYDATRATHGGRLGDYDVNLDFLTTHEGAAELAKILVPNLSASPKKLAERCVDSLSPDLDDDERDTRIARLRPAFKTLIEEIEEEVRKEEALRDLVARDDQATTATAAERLVTHLGAGRATEDDEAAYLRWILDRHAYLRTVGMVRNTTVQLSLAEIFVGLTARRESRPGDRSAAWHEQEQAKLQSMLEAGKLDQLGYEAAVDRLQLQLGYNARRAGDSASPEQLPVLDAVRNNQHLLVLGDPGSGKTTLLRYLALRHARALLGRSDTVGLGGVRLPVFLRIGEFARSPERHKGISAFAAEHFRSQECLTSGLRDLLQRKLDAGECLVLLDGLDEISSADDRRAVVEAVTSLITAHSRQGNRFVVTSRISGYAAAPLPAPFTAVRVEDMDDATIEAFLTAYCPAVERAEAPKKSADAVRHDADAEKTALLEALELNPGVRRLAVNPLLLTALVLVHRARGRLPHRRVEAYIEVAEALGRTWRSVQGVPEAELPDERLLTTWLTRLGSWLHEHRPEGSANKRELLAVLGPLWAKHHNKEWDDKLLEAADPLNSEAGQGVTDFVSTAEHHTGLIVERAPGRYGFPHLTFEEYYAGRALAFEGLAVDRVAGIRRRLHDPRYEEPILLALGLVGQGQPEEVERLVAEAIYPAPAFRKQYEELLGWDFLFALRVLADDIPLDTSTIDQLLGVAVDEWFNAGTSRCRFTRYREALADRFKGLKGTRAAARLLLILDRVTRWQTLSEDLLIELARPVASLGPLPKKIVEPLVAIATTADNLHVRISAIDALARADALTPETTQHLTHLATTADDPYVRSRAIETLAQADALTPETTQTAIHLATTADDLYVRIGAIDALVQADALTPETTQHLTHLATTANDPNVRISAIDALARADALTPETTQHLTHLATTANDPNVRSRAIETLAQADALTPETTQTAIHLATTANDPNVRISAIHALAQADALTPETTQHLTHLATTTNNPRVRISAIHALAKADALTPETTQTAIHLATTANDPNGRISAIDALVQADALTPETTQHLTHLATTANHPYVRIGAIYALAKADALTPETTQTAIHLATTAGNPNVRGIAGRLLVELTKRHPDILEPEIRASLASACTDAQVTDPDPFGLRTGQDHAHETLWTVTELLAARG